MNIPEEAQASEPTHFDKLVDAAEEAYLERRKLIVEEVRQEFDKEQP